MDKELLVHMMKKENDYGKTFDWEGQTRNLPRENENIILDGFQKGCPRFLARAWGIKKTGTYIPYEE